MSATNMLRIGGLVVLASLILRTAAMVIFPLFDTTEARYGEMARLMWETGNWVTPLFDYGVPFWGKPPLQTWASASGILLFGLSEFAVRLPHFIAGLIVVFLSYRFARSAISRDASPVLLLVLSCSPGFLLCIGMVMTDTFLTLGVTISMLSGWWMVYHSSPLTRRAFAYLFFAGLGIGMLAKGPVALVIVGLAMLPWLIICGQLVNLIKSLPWISGSLVMLMLCAPWYLLAEQATPGFLEYFIVGEHWSRFTVPGWQGDLYGNAHERTKGTIWLYMIYGSLPWLPWLLWQFFKRRKHFSLHNKELKVFLLCWWLSPALLFTFAGNILPAYVLPGVPAMALLVSLMAQQRARVILLTLGAITPLLMASLLITHGLGALSQSSDKGLLFEWQHKQQDISITYVSKRPFSGQFYSSGLAKVVTDRAELADLIRQKGVFVVDKKSELLAIFRENLCQLRNQNRHRLLYYCPGD